ncbi:F-box domain-containing protein [Mycena indigotica]|uniref:F-box domain-containing protein n=1 Tax=Mycena indigotica TaxID=2126181 RepID=A0A8H6W9J6_9AGAR|nr:F-box domain-containing protein [Mycena indigotica]KAF7304194.1 F-box domain-containing protein [Mycena indigotica]
MTFPPADNRRHKLRQLERVYHNTPDPYGLLAAKMESLQLRIPPQAVLPPELLADIFKLCTDFPDPTALPPKQDDLILTLTHVCASWRHIVLSLTELWSAIAINITTTRCDLIGEVATLSRSWLSRAGSNTISLTVECSRELAVAANSDPTLMSALSALMDCVVLQNTRRTRFLELRFPEPCVSTLFDVPEGSFSELQSFELSPYIFMHDMENENVDAKWKWRGSAPGFASASRLFHAAFTPAWPSLSDLMDNLGEETIGPIFNDNGGVGNGTASAFRATDVVLPWRNLRSLEFMFTMCPFDIWLNALSQCPLLERCLIGVSPGPLPVSPIQIRLENLDYIYIMSAEGGGDILLSSLVTPNLRSCSLQGHISVRSLFDFQRRSGFELIVLVTLLNIPTNDVYPLLEAFPTLVFLGFVMATTEHYPEDVWSRIARREVLPNLLYLIITPRVSQISALADAIAQNWELAEQAPESERSPLKVWFLAVPPRDVALLKEGLEPLERFAALNMQVEFRDI